MTPTPIARPAAVIALALGLSACGGSGGDVGRFESWAMKVADIRLSGDNRPSAPKTAAQAGLRPSQEPAPVRVQVMDVHDFWDARDAGLRGMIQTAAPAVVEAAAPVLVQAASDRIASAVEATPALTTRAVETARTTLQLGAYSSEQAARAAWAAVSNGEAATALAGLQPVFQPVQVDGRTLVRLRVAAPAQSAAAICQAARVNDPWCRANA